MTNKPSSDVDACEDPGPPPDPTQAQPSQPKPDFKGPEWDESHDLPPADHSQFSLI